MRQPGRRASKHPQVSVQPQSTLERSPEPTLPQCGDLRGRAPEDHVQRREGCRRRPWSDRESCELRHDCRDPVELDWASNCSRLVQESCFRGRPQEHARVLLQTRRLSFERGSHRAKSRESPSWLVPLRRRPLRGDRSFSVGQPLPLLTLPQTLGCLRRNTGARRARRLPFARRRRADPCVPAG
jgi:hypothetical protein